MDHLLIKSNSLSMTSMACPSQWEGETEDGKVVYIRYRHGNLTLGVGFDIETAVRNTIVRIKHGDSLDGVMDTGEMIELLSSHATFSGTPQPEIDQLGRCQAKLKELEAVAFQYKEQIETAGRQMDQVRKDLAIVLDHVGQMSIEDDEDVRESVKRLAEFTNR